MNRGFLSAAAAYVLWGVFPIYFKALHEAPAFQILAHRIFWSFLFLAILILIRREFKAFKSVINRRTLFVYFIAAVFLAFNWGIYVWAVNAGFVVESSLGYFINPLFSVLLGVVFLREKLRRVQWLAIAIAALGVLYITLNLGSLPWISLALAFTFGTYGLLKKLSPLGSLFGLTLETTTIALPAFAFLLIEEANGVGAFGHASSTTTLLLALSGVVTAIPLLLFATGARNVSLTTLGILQYIAPTLQFFCGVFIFNEQFNTARLIGFIIIWTALIIFSVDGLKQHRR